jgi:hypothetical protein
MFEVRSEALRNRLYVTLAGHLEAPERKAASEAILAEAARMAPGFDVVTDISLLHPSDPAGFREFLRVKAALKLRGVGHIIRVVKIPLSRIQVERVSESAGYPAESAPSLEEADRRLDELRSRR